MSDSSFDERIVKGATTLDFTIVPEDCPANEGTLEPYFKLTYGKPGRVVVRKELICDDKYSSDSHYEYKKHRKNRIKKRKHLATFVQITDVHIIDATSPARDAFLSLFVREVPLLAEAFRPYEAFSMQVAETMVRKINAVKKGPHLKHEFQLVVNTGDNGDGEQFNELVNYINVLDGKKVVPNPATPGKYIGVQDDFPSNLYGAYYHPDPPPPGKDFDQYKVDYGYPEFPNILDVAARPFKATGLNVPWFTCNGNHDTTKLGGYSLGFYKMLDLFDELSTGTLPEGLGSKLIESMTEFQAKAFFKALVLQDSEAAFNIIKKSNLRDVPNSDERRQFTRADYIRAHFNSTLCPGNIGHGFTKENIENDTVYYTFKLSDKIDGMMLDSCNPSGNLEDASKTANGSFGRIQMNWFEKELRKRHSSYYNDVGQLVKTDNKDVLVMVFCHHTIETLNNNFNSPTTFDNDPQRILGDDFVRILHRYPNVIVFQNGHEHLNRITPFPDPSGKTQGFWEINTASHIDYPQQSRIVEVGENDDDTLSIFCTMIDHQSVPNAHRGCFPTGPARNCCGSSSYTDYSTDRTDSHNTTDSHNRTDSSDYRTGDIVDYYKRKSSSLETTCETNRTSCETECQEDYTIEEMASISRELSYNDSFIVDLFDTGENRTGTPADRNVELLLFNPLKRCKDYRK